MIYKFGGYSYEESYERYFTHDIEYTKDQFEDFITEIGNTFVKSKVDNF